MNSKMSKVLRRRTWNNGYGCSCCAQNRDDVDWIEEGEMVPLEEMFGLLKQNQENMTDDHLISEVYEKDGEILYGYESNVYKMGEDGFILRRNQGFMFTSSIHPGRCKSKEDILSALSTGSKKT